MVWPRMSVEGMIVVADHAQNFLGDVGLRLDVLAPGRNLTGEHVAGEHGVDIEAVEDVFHGLAGERRRR